MIHAANVMRDVAVTLLDTDYIRWTPAELAGYIDDAIKTIITVKPSAASRTIVLPLVRGTRQTLPGDQRYKQLLDIVRNTGGTNGAAGRAIRPTTRHELDAHVPRWHDPSYAPFRPEVRQFVFDETVPMEFLVVPGNDGTGAVEAIVVQVPVLLREQVAPEHQEDLAAWTGITVAFDDIYEPAIKDYVLYRCFSKEEPAAAPGRAAGHYQAFATILGIRAQVESATNPARKST